MSQFEEIPSPGRGFQGSRALGGLAACKTLASKLPRLAFAVDAVDARTVVDSQGLAPYYCSPFARAPSTVSPQSSSKLGAAH